MVTYQEGLVQDLIHELRRLKSQAAGRWERADTVWGRGFQAGVEEAFNQAILLTKRVFDYREEE